LGDREDIREAKEPLRLLPMDELRISILTPLPGSLIYNEFKEKRLILTNDFFQIHYRRIYNKNTYLSFEEILEN